MKILIRNAAAEDIAALQTIYAHHVMYGTATFEEIPPSVDDLLVRRSSVVSSGLPYLVAEVEGRIVGYTYATAYHQRSAYRYTVEDSVYVANDFGLRGVGHALLSELIAQCELGPWRQMLAIIGDSSNAASIALHSRMGFQPAGALRCVGLKFGRWVDTVLMQRPLGLGAGGIPNSSL